MLTVNLGEPWRVWLPSVLSFRFRADVAYGASLYVWSLHMSAGCDR